MLICHKQNCSQTNLATLPVTPARKSSPGLNMSLQLWELVAHVAMVVFLSDTAGGFILSSSQCIATSPCTCYSSNYVYCQGKSLTDVPRFIAATSQEHVSPFYVYLYSNQLTTIPDNAFKNLSSINTTKLYLQLNSNKLSVIRQHAFAGVENSTYSINLSNNNLTTLPAALSTLRNLHELYLTGNQLKILDKSVTSNLADSLTHFEFDMGAFQSWPYELGDLHNLNTLTIQHIPFNHLTLNAFDRLGASLTSLSLSYTQLPRIPSAICHLKNLQTFTFNYNSVLESNFTLFEPCQHKLDKLTTLSLQSNKLASFPDLLPLFPSLRTLNLANNQIRFIHTNQIPFHNKITNIQLTSNRFAHIPFAINKMKDLQYLYLANNQIVTIEDHDLISLFNLYELDIYNNPIEYVAPHAFKNNRHIRDLEFQSTKLTMVPEAVLSLPDLSYFPFTGNHVQCTCAMSYLKGWNTTKVTTFTGNCENMPNVSIKQFISFSLQSCV